MKSRPWTQLLLALTALKVLGGVTGFLSILSTPAGPRETILTPGYLFAILLAFVATGAFLLTSGKSDERAVTLGAAFLVLATPFAYRPLGEMVLSAPPEGGWPALFLFVLPVDAFLPWLFWSFAQEFPNSVSSFKVQRLLSVGRRTALLAGIAGFLWQSLRLAVLLQKHGFGGSPALSMPVKPSYEYYGPILLLTIPAFAILFWRTRGASGEEGRRARLFAAALGIGLSPMFLHIAVEFLIAPYREWFDVGGRRVWLVHWVLVPCLVSVPFTTAYSVLVAHVLQVRLMARKALQYALARYSALAIAVVPLAAMAYYVFENRTRKIEEMFSGGPQLLLLGASFLVGAGALRYRRTLLDSIDRHFFREEYDSRQTLTLLVERIRATHGVTDLANLLCREVDLALHPESVSLMAFDPRAGMLADSKIRSRRLDASSSLAILIASASDPLPVDMEDVRSPLAKLPEKERHWLVDSGFRLIVPILARDGSQLGLIGLGEKKSGLPFFKEDRQLLRAIASSAAWVLELELGRSMGSSHKSWQDPVDGDAALPFPEGGGAGELAKECPNCGRLHASYTVFCAHCSRRLEPSHVPYVLPGKFRFERRIGTGGMGVVYRGSDLALGRPVAVKTLRRVSPEDAMRLRREARTAAAVSHRHLAPVYGMETWQGTPMLIMELLEGGTLTQRIEKAKLGAPETIDLGIAMAEALEHLHASDILHRDIKPSNIGYTRDGVPKLMDFGIARVMFDLRRDEIPSPASLDEDSVLLPPTSVWSHSPTSVTASKQLVGTLAYLSPEALLGQPADTSFDLWSLAIVLHECLLGRKIFSGGDMHQLMTRIRAGRVPDFSQTCPEHDEKLGEFFRAALHKTITRRPASAREFRERLATARPRFSP